MLSLWDKICMIMVPEKRKERSESALYLFYRIDVQVILTAPRSPDGQSTTCSRPGQWCHLQTSRAWQTDDWRCSCCCTEEQRGKGAALRESGADGPQSGMFPQPHMWPLVRVRSPLREVQVLGSDYDDDNLKGKLSLMLEQCKDNNACLLDNGGSW